MYKKILVAIDKSDHSKKAIEHAKAIATKFDAEVVLYHSYQVPADLVDHQIMYNLDDNYVQQMQDNLKKHYQDVLDEYKKGFDDANLKATTLLENGKAGANIIKAADSTNADFVIIGSRGLGSVRSVLMGSVSSYVLHHIKKPLLIVE
ncbi:universal stress protein [Candidatus Uabimicrobium amorphum]|uniref:Universal stress protein n=1 Tax=Uabimicrobium amorphum TaxID=2596890 RepID=A0A5S9F309_UABAM|nr:universal stress protein [Candidatus Uabimicrobium amorphum]BBM84186.1 universal stress protein [Candidatus Uabimicrobium amorphum]